MKAESKRLLCYLHKHSYELVLYMILFLCVWGAWIYNTNLRIDTEVLINSPYSDATWLSMGRQGGILTEIVFSLRWFNPYFSTTIGFLLLYVSGVLVTWLFARASKNEHSLFFLPFSLIVFTHYTSI